MGFNRFWFLNFKSFNHVEQVYFIESKLIHFPFTVSPYIFNRDLNHCLLGSSAFRWASGSEVKITICIFGKLQQSVSGEFVFFYIFLRWFRLYMDIQFIVSWRIVRIDDLFRFDPKKYFQSSGSELWNYYPRLIDLLLGQLYTIYYIKITDSVLFFKWPDSGFQITLGDLTLTQKWTFKVFDTVRSHS